MAHLYKTISQDHCLLPSAMRHKSALCSNLFLKRFCHFHWMQCHDNVRRCLSLHQNVNTGEHFDEGCDLMSFLEITNKKLHQHLACTLTHWLGHRASELIQKSCHSAIFIHCFCSSGQLHITYWGLQVRWLEAVG